MLLDSHFSSGFAGVATITIWSGTIADIIPLGQRGKAVSVWSVGTVFDPMVGPAIGGYVTGVAGWRWIFWASSIGVSWYWYASLAGFCG
jgi:MFS family permease